MVPCPLWRLEKVEMHVLPAVIERCSAELRGGCGVLDDEPRYHSTLRQVHTQRHTHKHMHAQTE